jgi:hypothetical protein
MGNYLSPQFGMNISALSVVSGLAAIILLLVGFPAWASFGYAGGRYPAIWEPWNIICLIVGGLLAIIAGLSIRRDLK